MVTPSFARALLNIISVRPYHMLLACLVENVEFRRTYSAVNKRDLHPFTSLEPNDWCLIYTNSFASCKSLFIALKILFSLTFVVYYKLL